MADIKFTGDFNDLLDGIRTVKGLEASMKSLQRAEKAGIITNRQSADAVAELNAMHKQAVYDMNQFGRIADANTRKMKRFSAVGLQQVGYQVGDFAVQVQSGTNVAVAFGQQMSQLLGILGPYGALAGAGVAIGTAFVAPLLDARKASKELSDGLKDAREKVKNLADEIRFLGSSLKDELELPFIDNIAQLEEKLRKAQDTYREALTNNQPGGFGSLDPSAQAELEDTLTGAAKERVEEARKELEAARALLATKERLAEIENKANEAAARYQARKEINAELQKELALNQLILRYGKDSTIVEIMKKRYAREAFALKLQESHLYGTVAAKLMKIYDANVLIKDKIEEQQKEIKKNQEQLEKALKAFIGISTTDAATSIANAADKALLLADRLGRAANAYASIGGLLSGVGGFFGGLFKPPADGKGGLGWSNAPTFYSGDPFGRADNENFGQDKPSGGGGGGGAGADETLKNLKEQLVLERELMGLKEAESFVLSSLGADWRNYSQDSIAALVELKQANLDLQEVIQRQDDMMMAIDTAMNSAFDGIIDGTKSVKEAFGEMIIYIVKEWAKINFIQPFINNLTGDGGLLRSLFGKRASGGGVVGGGAYLVGEQGPELFTPSTNGRIVNSQQTGKMMGGAGEVKVEVQLSPDLEARILQTSSKQSAAITYEGIKKNRSNLTRDIQTVQSRGTV